MRVISLAGPDWTLTGYWQNQWKQRGTGTPLRPTVPSVRAVVPGAVHADLLRAGIIPDWQNGLNARLSEWVNNREWILSREVTVPKDFTGQLTLECDGLDYSGHVLVNGELIGDFEGTHFRHRFDLTGRVRPGETFTLEVIFHLAPQVEGQVGATSQTRIFKPRFGYYWDWCPRLVNVGIWQDLRLVSRGPARWESCRVLPRVGDDLSSGAVRVAGRVQGAWRAIRYVLARPGGGDIRGEWAPGADGVVDFAIPVERVQLWWPATHGSQPLYRLTLELLDEHGAVSDRIERTVGFKRVRWLKNPGAPADARPYLCEVNGRPVFLRGVNWVPLSPFYGTPTGDQYEAYVRLYRHMNANLLRVWGGGILERPEFYEACDRLGLLVWQEFPLSSSGIDNWPPEEPAVIEHLQAIAAEYIERRGHHACHLLWCGGNELQGALDGGKVGQGRPVDESHPLMRRWQELVERLDPGKRFLAASPSGPRFYAVIEAFGKGLHHHTHGPWGNLPSSERYAYFNGDDTIFRTETGAPGCASLASLERHKGDQSLWPPRPSNPHWTTPGDWWVPWDDVVREFGPIADDPAQLPVVVKASRYLQAESYRYAAEATRRRFPGSGAFLIWMGHDAVHCTVNNSVVQIDGSTKPAFDWLREAYAGRQVSLKHNCIAYAAGSRFEGEIWIHQDEMVPISGAVRVLLRGLTGQVFASRELEVQGVGFSIKVGSVTFETPAFEERLFVVELVWENEFKAISARYLLSQQPDAPLRPFLDLPAVRVNGRLEQPGRVVVTNEGPVAAIGVRLVSTDSGMILLCEPNHLLVFPGEAVPIGFEWSWGRAGGDKTGLAVECFNTETTDGVR